MNGKLDLLQAEAINDLVNAESCEQSKLSLMALEGRNSAVYNRLRQKLVKMLAHIEAYIDFEADEVADVSAEVLTNLQKEVHDLLDEIRVHIKRAEISETIKEGLKVAILGPPNAGKSTLMN